VPDAIHEPLARDVTLDELGAQDPDDAERLPRNRRVVVGNPHGSSPAVYTAEP
jgi:hypothetical protein